MKDYPPLTAEQVEELGKFGRRIINDRHCPICDGLGARGCICPLDGKPNRASNNQGGPRESDS